MDDEDLDAVRRFLEDRGASPSPAHGFYTLDEHGQPQACDDVLAWARWMEEHRNEKHIALDLDEGDGEKRVRVSTVFLGIDHGFFSEGPPILWETMVFGGPLDGEQERYTSREAAFQGHQLMCQRVMAAK